MSGVVLSAQEATRLEEAFLGGLEEAQDAYEQIVAHEAWTALGYDTFADWWTERVTPTMRALSMRPTREIAARVVEQVRREEAALPPAQRRTQQDLADMVGTTRDEVRDRSARSVTRGIPRTPDLEWDGNRIVEKPIVDPLPAQIAEQIEQRIAEKTAPRIEPADPAVRERIAREREEQQSREAYSKTIAHSVWLLAEYARRIDAANWTVDQWEPSQDIYPEPTTSERLRAAGDFLHNLAEVWPK